MEINLSAPAICSDGRRSTITNIIINPVSRAITALVVRTSGRSSQVILPFDRVGTILQDQIQLKCTGDELNRCERFVEEHFEKLDVPGSSLAGYLMLPYVLPGTLMIPVRHKHIPAGQLAVRRGSRVRATDGAAGSVDEFLIDPASGHITHLVMRRGHLIGQKDVSIPVDMIDTIDDEGVQLRISIKDIKRLPHISIWRRFVPDADWSEELETISAAAAKADRARIDMLAAGLGSRSRRKRTHCRHELAAIGKPVIPALCTLLNAKKRQVVWEAVKTLAQMQHPDCIPGLLTAMEDTRFDICWVAAEGMVALGSPALKKLLERLQERPDIFSLREGAHHVIRALLGDNPWKEMQDVLLQLEDFSPLSSLPRAAAAALQSMHKHPEIGPRRPPDTSRAN